jgi:dihydropteroate synthase
MARMPFSPRPRFAWKLRSRTLALGDRTLLMAIVNLTPDSFSGDGLLRRKTDIRSPEAVAELGTAAAITALDGGADIVDLGAESTRPNAVGISADEEQEQLLPVVESLMKFRPTAVISADTYHAATARAATKAGAEIVNDVSGLEWDPEMAAAVAQAGSGLVLMHSRGRPTEWRDLERISADSVVPMVFAGLCERLYLAESAGIASERVMVDPGFGFGKAGMENVILLSCLTRLHELGRPLLVGVSRKGFLGQLVRPVQPAGLPIADARRLATAAAGVVAVLGGAHVLRVHDVQVARETVAVADAVMNAVEEVGTSF